MKFLVTFLLMIFTTPSYAIDSEADKKLNELLDKIDVLLEIARENSTEIDEIKKKIDGQDGLESKILNVKEKISKNEEDIKNLISSPNTSETDSGNLVKVTYTTDRGNNNSDNQRINSRLLKFRKEESDTDIRILYSDNFRVIGKDSGSACRWTVLVDGVDCSSGQIFSDLHEAPVSNTHRTSTIVAYCSGLPAGNHTLTVVVTPVPHDDNVFVGSDCFTGWLDAAWTLEAAEVRKPGQ